MDLNSASNFDYQQLPPYLRPYSYPTGGYSFYSYSHTPSLSPPLSSSPEDLDEPLRKRLATGSALPTYCPPPHLFRPVDFEAPEVLPKRSRRLLATPSDSDEDASSESSRSSGTIAVIGRDSTYSKDGITVCLQEADLWSSFNSVGNEMIVTKPGRRLFPSLLVSIKGLKPDGSYSISLRIRPADNYRYKFLSMRWVAVGESEIMQDKDRQLYKHPNNPKTGSFWMKKPISFKPCKITHNSHSKHGNILVHTMHKYVMDIIVTKAQSEETTTIRLDATEFIAVTAYQNSKLTQLKIDNNPFAKGFRERDLGPLYHDEHSAMNPIVPAQMPWMQPPPSYGQHVHRITSMTPSGSSHSPSPSLTTPSPAPEYPVYSYPLPRNDSSTPPPFTRHSLTPPLLTADSVTPPHILTRHSCTPPLLTGRQDDRLTPPLGGPYIHSSLVAPQTLHI